MESVRTRHQEDALFQQKTALPLCFRQEDHYQNVTLSSLNREHTIPKSGFSGHFPRKKYGEKSVVRTVDSSYL